MSHDSQSCLWRAEVGRAGFTLLANQQSTLFIQTTAMTMRVRDERIAAMLLAPDVMTDSS